MKYALALALACLFVAASATAKPHRYVDLLRGSHSALEHQNRQADKEHLTRLTEKTLRAFKQKRILVPLPASKTLVVDSRLPAIYRWCRPETADFLKDFSRDYYNRWHEPLRINSAVRTVERQQLLRKSNGNAAKANAGPRRSSHLTGATIDIAKIDMSTDEQKWVGMRLRAYEEKGRVEATEEHRQAVYHVMIFQVPKKHHVHPKTHREPPHRRLVFHINADS